MPPSCSACVSARPCQHWLLFGHSEGWVLCCAFICIFLLPKQDMVFAADLPATQDSSSVNRCLLCWVVHLLLLICRTLLYSGNRSTLRFMCCKYLLLLAAMCLSTFLWDFSFLFWKNTSKTFFSQDLNSLGSIHLYLLGIEDLILSFTLFYYVTDSMVYFQFFPCFPSLRLWCTLMSTQPNGIFHVKCCVSDHQQQCRHNER